MYDDKTVGTHRKDKTFC